MGWFQMGLVSIAFFTGFGLQAAPVASLPVRSSSSEVVARCDDFVKVVGEVFTGRTGATFRVGRETAYLSGDTFGPKVLDIGGVDPARYLHQHCG